MATKAQIKTRARRKADMEGSAFIGTAEEDDLFKEAYKEVYDLFAKNGLQMLKAETTVTFPLPYTLPATFFSVLHIWQVIGDVYSELEKAEEDAMTSIRSLIGNEAYYYEILRTSTNTRQLKLYPIPTAGTYIVQYVPECPDLTADGDVLVEMGNSNSLVTCLLAKRYLMKEDSHNKELDEECGRLYTQIQEMATRVEMQQYGRIQDVRNKQYSRDPFRYNVWRDDE